MSLRKLTVFLRAGVTLLLTLPASTQLRSADSLQPDPAFLPSFVLGEQGQIFAIHVDSEDRTYVGGSFDAGDGVVVRRSLMRLLPDGSIDPSFSFPAELESWVTVLTFASDGKIYVGTGNELLRLEADGTLDLGFTSQLSFPSVKAIVIDGDGKVLVAGSVRVGSSGPEGIVRLEATGAIDVTFNPGGSGSSSDIETIALLPDGKILIGGSFFNDYNGTTRKAIARLNADGTLDTAFDAGDNPGNGVLDIVVQPDGKILIAGDFGTFPNGKGGKVARLEANGAHDTSFVGFGSFGSGGRDIHLLPDGRVLAVGGFIPDGSFTEDRVVRLTSSGTVDAVFETPAGDTFQPMRIAVRPDGSFTVAGQAEFDYELRPGFKSADALFTWGADDAPAENFFSRVGLPGCVSTILPHPAGGILVGGQFEFVNGVASGGVAHINADGSLNTEFNVGDNLGSDPVYDLAIQPDGKVLLAGGLFRYGPTVVNGVVRLLPDGSLDPSFTSATPAFNTIVWMLLQTDGKVLAGSFSNAVFRLNPDGSIDESFDIGTGPSRATSSAVVQDDGKIVLVGEFETFNGTPSKGIVRLNTDGSIDSSFAVGTGFIQTNFFPIVDQIALQPDGKFVVTGRYEGYQGTMRRSVVRINSDGSLDATYDPWANTSTNTQPTGLFVQSDGKTLFVGNFRYNSSIAGDPNDPDGLARINLDGSLDTSLGVLPFDDAGAWYLQCLRYDAVISTGGIIYIAPLPEALSGFLGGGVMRIIPGGPIITNQPDSNTTQAGFLHDFEVTVVAEEPISYQWQVNGVDIPGATASSYVLQNLQPYHSGTYTVVVTAGNGTITSEPAILIVRLPETSDSRLMNISTRALCLTGDDVLIPGFVVEGTGSKKLLIRAIGSRLADFGVTGALADPQMVLTQATTGGAVELSSLDDWGDNTDVAEVISVSDLVGAFELITDSKDAAQVQNLGTGRFTVVASGVGDTTGVAIVEVFDADAGSPTATLTNISNRGFVDTGANIMIPGFVVSDGGPIAVLIRAVGPRLAEFGVQNTLEDPQFTVFYRAPGATSDVELVSNNDWGSIPDPSSTASYADTVGAFGLSEGSKDAALVLVLQPGSYTAQVSGVDNTTGVALVEVYVIPLGQP